MNPLASLTLEGRHVRLEPLTDAHIPALLAAVNESRDTYEWTIVPNDEPSMRAYLDFAFAERDAGTSVPFATVALASGRVVGTTRFRQMERWTWPAGSPLARTGDHPDSLEIGYTWLAASAQRTPINTEAKYLQLRHAFETWRVHRVFFLTDENNARSRRAIERIGGVSEGVLRRNRPSSDHTRVRSTAVFSVVADEWPAVKAALEARLG